MKRIWILIAVTVAAGCAGLSGQQHRYAFADDRSDDEYCVKQGLHYPDAGYIECRRDLQNTRLLRAWKNQQMMKAGASSGNPMAGRPFTLHTDDFRPLDAAHFQCRAFAEYGTDVIACSETQSPPRQ